jgi:hypothetical protein
LYAQINPLGSISITMECGDLPDRVADYNPNRSRFPFKPGLKGLKGVGGFLYCFFLCFLTLDMVYLLY